MAWRTYLFAKPDLPLRKESFLTAIAIFKVMFNETRGGICQCRYCRRQCKIFASGVNFSIFTNFLCFFLLKLLKLGEIDGVKFLAWKSGGVKFWTNFMSGQPVLDITPVEQNLNFFVS